MIKVAFEEFGAHYSEDDLCILEMPTVPRIDEWVVLPPEIGFVGKVIRVMWFVGVAPICDVRVSLIRMERKN